MATGQLNGKNLPGSTTYSLGVDSLSISTSLDFDEIVTKCTFQLCWVESVDSTYMQLLVYNVDSLHTCTLHTWSFKIMSRPAVCAAGGVALAWHLAFPSLVSVVCYRLQYMLRCTLRATLVTRGRVAFYMGPPVVPPYATFYISPFIVVQLTLNLTINP